VSDKKQSTEDKLTENASVEVSRWQGIPLLNWMGLRLRTLFAEVKVQRRNRRLRLCESLSLGEKRIVAVVEFEDQRFLLAATPQNISLLQSLGPVRAEEK
jgi:flagellar biogenesis protein FliO